MVGLTGVRRLERVRMRVIWSLVGATVVVGVFGGGANASLVAGQGLLVTLAMGADLSRPYSRNLDRDQTLSRIFWAVAFAPLVAFFFFGFLLAILPDGQITKWLGAHGGGYVGGVLPLVVVVALIAETWLILRRRGTALERRIFVWVSAVAGATLVAAWLIIEFTADARGYPIQALNDLADGVMTLGVVTAVATFGWAGFRTARPLAAPTSLESVVIAAPASPTFSSYARR